ncbi:hypothetical protein JZ751_009406 [Albula glossodonta]|uniref:Uncharacterized protein n=1 Tax=Albula glossodonta TaxID=121402 RepID=A0A8T2NBL8_9TELE|nr:hypothetical protein JZ751_009406 [Albula glossodonta]
MVGVMDWRRDEGVGSRAQVVDQVRKEELGKISVRGEKVEKDREGVEREERRSTVSGKVREGVKRMERGKICGHIREVGVTVRSGCGAVPEQVKVIVGSERAKNRNGIPAHSEAVMTRSCGKRRDEDLEYSHTSYRPNISKHSIAETAEVMAMVSGTKVASAQGNGSEARRVSCPTHTTPLANESGAVLSVSVPGPLYSSEERTEQESQTSTSVTIAWHACSTSQTTAYIPKEGGKSTNDGRRGLGYLPRVFVFVVMGISVLCPPSLRQREREIIEESERGQMREA